MNIAGPTIQPITSKRWILKIVYALSVMGLHITIAPAFTFDGASIPRILWRVIGHPLEGLTLPGATIHDALYRTKLLSRERADRIFYELLKLNGVGRFKSWIMYRGVRLFGQKSWDAYNESAVIFARQFVKVEYDKRRDKEK